MGEIKMLGQKGIFLTFMAFLLASTVLVMSISASNIETRQQHNLVEETAFREVNSRFNNIRQQIAVAKEGDASRTYSRITPFRKFSAESNWFSVEQNFPFEEAYMNNAYDALNLFAIFSEKKGSEGLKVSVPEPLKNDDWGGSSAYPSMSYLVKPQCMKFYMLNDVEVSYAQNDKILFKGGSASDDCEQNFSFDDIESVEIEIRVPNVGAKPTCSGRFGSGITCKNEPQGDDPYVKVTYIWENCFEPNCSAMGFDSEGRKEIFASFPDNSVQSMIWLAVDGGPPYTEWAVVEFASASYPDEEFCLRNVQYAAPEFTSKFKATVRFGGPIDETIISKGAFDFSVEKPGFELCRATDESDCGG